MRDEPDEKWSKRLLRIAHHASLITILLLAACSPAPHIEQREFLAMGTTVSITVADTTPTLPAVLADIERDFRRLSNEWYAWSKNGELAKLNAAFAADQSFTVSAELAALLQQADNVYRASDGAFDPAVAPMVERWGFNDLEATPNAPTASQLQAWSTSHATYADIRIAGETIRSVRRDLMLDLGAIGKGYAVDRAIESLRRAGIRNAIVNAGGNLRAIGRHPEHAWRIGIRNPRGHPLDKGALFSVELRGDESVSTSGDYERAANVNGKRAHHLLDPHTGEPALHTASMTVFASDATLADAASTALFVAGPDRWLDLAKRLQLIGAIRIDAAGAVYATRSLQPRLHVPDRTVELRWLDL